MPANQSLGISLSANQLQRTRKSNAFRCIALQCVSLFCGGRNDQLWIRAIAIACLDGKHKKTNRKTKRLKWRDVHDVIYVEINNARNYYFKQFQPDIVICCTAIQWELFWSPFHIGRASERASGPLHFV